MFKKDIGLLILILVVGTVVAVINPLFLSVINLGNTANLVGLFGIFAIGQAFVIHRRHRIIGRLGHRTAGRIVC